MQSSILVMHALVAQDGTIVQFEVAKGTAADMLPMPEPLGSLRMRGGGLGLMWV